MTLKYTIEFYDYWHLGSGLSAGAKLDSTVVKDANNLPYAPGKTIKGLVREMAEEFKKCVFINECFGVSSDKEDKCFTKDEQFKKGGICYFTNATLQKTTQQEIISNNLQDNLYDTVASTKIEDGVAVDDTLREIEVVVPLVLYGEILDVPDIYKADIEKSLKMIKRMGLNRNRGLGRCEFKELTWS